MQKRFRIGYIHIEIRKILADIYAKCGKNKKAYKMCMKLVSLNKKVVS